ncbi:MAG TPA: hypothetical protein VM553_04890, partial [Dongiaceae bacterium]|nr:hypothetical protein [Dongiaceae bacterium]
YTTTVQRLGGTPSKGSDVRRILAQGKVLLADMLGNDITIMKATKLNEDITNIKYEKALRRCSKELHDLLARHRESEQRYNTWLLSTLASEPQKNTGVPR